MPGSALVSRARDAARWVRQWAGSAFRRTVVQAVSFSGARVGRLVADWVFAPLVSADQELRGDHTMLRRRARELSRNTWYGKRFLDMLEENVVGPHGIRMQARCTLGDGRSPDTESNRRIEAAWARWSEPENCSVDGRLSWEEIQALAIRTLAQDGECLVRMVEGFGDNPFGFALQVLDVDQIDSDLNRTPTDGVNEIRMGVEVNGWGRPVAYHVFPRHPYDYQQPRGSRRPERIPASEIAHIYLMDRVGRSRGVTWFASILEDGHMLRGLQQAELVASRMAAVKAGVLQRRQDAAAIPDPRIVNQGKDPADDFKLELSPGIYPVIPANLELKEVDPTHPNDAFEGFNRIILRSISSGLRAAYAGLSGDLTQVSFSSIRDGTIRERDVYRLLQWFLVRHLHRKVRSRWMLWALTTGELRLASRDPEDWAEHQWQPRGWDWVDPLKDILAAKEEIALGVNSRTRIAAERGRDIEEVLREIAAEQKLARELGVDLGGEPTDPEAATDLAEMDDDDYERIPPKLLARLTPPLPTNGKAHARLDT